MGVDGVNEWTPTRKSGEIPLVSTSRITLSAENKQAEAGETGRTCLANAKFKVRTGTGKNKEIPRSAADRIRIGNLVQLVHTILSTCKLHANNGCGEKRGAR